MDSTDVGLLVIMVVVVLFFAVFMYLCSSDRPGQPEETPAQRMARVMAEWEGLAARTEAVSVVAHQRGPPPVLMALPYFPYAAQGGGAPETPECSICLEQFRQGQLCSEVPACRHVFHGECLGAWARSSGSCPLCRAKLVPESDGVKVADDMV